MNYLNTLELNRMIIRNMPDTANFRLKPVSMVSKNVFTKKSYINIIALAEAVTILEENIKIDRAGIARALEELLIEKNIIMQESEVVFASLQKYRSGKMSFSDCLKSELDERFSPVST